MELEAEKDEFEGSTGDEDDQKVQPSQEQPQQKRREAKEMRKQCYDYEEENKPQEEKSSTPPPIVKYRTKLGKEIALANRRPAIQVNYFMRTRDYLEKPLMEELLKIEKSDPSPNCGQCGGKVLDNNLTQFLCGHIFHSRCIKKMILDAMYQRLDKF